MTANSTRYYVLTLVTCMMLLALPLGFAPTASAQGRHDQGQLNPQATPTPALYDSLAVGVPYEDIGDRQDAGGVNIIPGSPDGLTATGNQGWNQDSTGVLGSAEPYDNFGSALAAGDFNGDGFPDLAIGVPTEDVETTVSAGAVQVLYGSASGLTATDNQWWTQDSPGVAGGAEAEDYFGGTVAAGDFNGDGYADLAIGVAGEDVGNISDAGAVQVLYGSASGLTAISNQLWSQDSPGIAGGAEEGDQMGGSLITGDFNKDGYADLAIGIVFEDVGSTNITDAGAVLVLYGSPTGLTATGNQLWALDNPNIPGTPEAQDYFGGSLAAGDFDGDGYADLAIASPSESVGNISGAGSVRILFGSGQGLTTAGVQWWSQDSPGVLESAEVGDLFGWALAAGDFDGDGYADLAISSREGLESNPRAGAVQILYGTSGGLTSAGDQLWHQNNGALPGSAEAYDLFGEALAAGDFNGDGYADLAIGIPGESLEGKDHAGAVQVLFGSVGGLTANGNQWWDQDSPDIDGMLEAGDRFGQALAVIPLPFTPPTCPQDPYEPNNTYETAYEVTPPLYINGTAYICPDYDRDFFKFYAANGSVIEITLGHLPANYDMSLFGPNGFSVAHSANSGTLHESIQYTATQPGYYTLVVDGMANNWSWSADQGYWLELTVQGANIRSFLPLLMKP